MQSRPIEQKDEESERCLDPKDSSENLNLRLPSRITQAVSIENQRYENAMLYDDRKMKEDSSILESSILDGRSGSSRKTLGMNIRYKNQSGPGRRMLPTHPFSPNSSSKKSVNVFKDAKNPSSCSSNSFQLSEGSNSSILVHPFYKTSPKRSLKDNLKLFDGSQTTLPKNMQPNGFKDTIRISRSQNNPKKGTHDFYGASKKIKKLRTYFGPLGEKQISEVRTMQENQSGLSCEEKKFLRRYPVPQADPLGLNKLLEED